MKAQAELPSLRLRYWDWRLCLAARLDVSLFASYFQAQTALRPEPWLHQVRIWSNTEQDSTQSPAPREARAGLGGASSLLCSERDSRSTRSGARNGIDDIRTWMPASKR